MRNTFKLLFLLSFFFLFNFKIIPQLINGIKLSEEDITKDNFNEYLLNKRDGIPLDISPASFNIENTDSNYVIDSIVTESTKIFFSYDEDYNIILKTIQYLTDNEWIDSHRQSFRYDEKNNLSFYTDQTFIKNKWHNFFKGTYRFNEDQSIQEIFFYLYTNNRWCESSYIKNHLTNGKITLKEKFNREEETPYTKISYEYDQNGNRVLEIASSFRDSVSEGSTKYELTYDDFNNMLSYKVSDWRENKWLLMEIGTLEYNDRQQLIHHIVKVFDPSPVTNYELNATYFKEGNTDIIEYERRYYNGEYAKFRKELTKDEFGNFSQGKNFYFNNNQWEPNIDQFEFSDSFGRKYDIGGSSIKVFYSKTSELSFPDFKNSKFYLYNNYPNPFNPATTIRYSISENLENESTKVSIKIYDILGHEIATLVNEEQFPGNYKVKFYAAEYNLSSGVYFYRFQSGDFFESKKMLLLK